MSLIIQTDQQLSAAVAEFVAGWTKRNDPGYDLGTGEGARPHTYWIKDHREWPMPPPFATSADAVLPLLDTWQRDDMFRRVEVRRWDAIWVLDLKGSFTGQYCATTFSRAACIALLRAKGVDFEWRGE